MVKQTMQRETITPKMAEKYLNANKANRTLRDGVVERYTFDMKHGKWTDCATPITFYEDGDIADGQHRLYAIVEAGEAFQFWVLRGLSRQSGLNIDTGLNRTIVDNGRISGVDVNLSNTLVALAMFYDLGTRNQRGSSMSERIRIVNKHREVCLWAITNGPTHKGFRNAVIMGAMARAYAHGADPDRLAKFAKIMKTGLSDGSDDAAAIAFRNYIITRNYRIDATDSHDVFLKCQNAISYFVRRKQLNSIRGVSEEVYPLKGAKR